ncbi:MAG: Csa1 family protein [Sarcina sp.]
MKKLAVILVIIILPIQVLGCSSKHTKSESQVLSAFTGFIDILSEGDLMMFFSESEKIVNSEGKTLNWHPANSKMWLVSSSFDSGDKMVDVTLYFDREKKEANGTVDISTKENGEEGYNISGSYPAYYDEEGLHLKNENVPKSVKKEVEEFIFLNEFLEVTKEDLDELQDKKIDYNYSSKRGVEFYTADYKLKPDDKNIKKVRELYPDISIDEQNVSLKFETRGNDWDESKDLEFNLDDKYDVGFRFIVKGFDYSWEDDEEEKINEKQVEEIEQCLDDFIVNFNNIKLEDLYEKEGGKSLANIENNNKVESSDELESDDLGIWEFGDTIKGNKFDSEGLSLTEVEAKGTINKNSGTKEILFEGKDARLASEDYKLDESELNKMELSKEEALILSRFKPMNEIIKIDKEYLENLEVIEQSGDIGGYEYQIKYKLEYTDENIKRIKEAYPNLEIHDTECSLELSGHDAPWAFDSSVKLRINLNEDEEVYLETYLNFREDYKKRYNFPD